MLEPGAIGFELEPSVAGDARNMLVIAIAYTATSTYRFSKEFSLNRTSYQRAGLPLPSGNQQTSSPNSSAASPSLPAARGQRTPANEIFAN